MNFQCFTQSHTHSQTPSHLHKHRYTNSLFSSTVRTRFRQSIIFFEVQQQFYSFMLWCWLLVVVVTPKRLGFSYRLVCEGFMVVKRRWFWFVSEHYCFKLSQSFHSFCVLFQLSVINNHVKVILATASLSNN